MKKTILYTLMLVILLPLLAGCNGPPLLKGDYSGMEIIKHGELVYKTNDVRETKELVDMINRSKREETNTWELPEPVGTLTFHRESEEITLPLYEEGVVINEYFVYASFDF